MIIETVTIADVTDPSELQRWLDEHPTAVINRILNVSGIFYIFYTEA